MALKIIGSGFGRTGTLSTKRALEILGFGPCHHMEEVFANPGQVPLWQAIGRGEAVDWDQVFHGYVSQVDWPGAYVWRETAAAFPDAKVLHTMRPDEDWWKSFSTTIGKLMRVHAGLPLPPHIADMMDTASGFVPKLDHVDPDADRQTALAAYHQRLADVRAAIPAERLLVFDVAQGWEPLCAFLGVPVPDQPFPRSNGRGEFWASLGGEPA